MILSQLADRLAELRLSWESTNRAVAEEVVRNMLSATKSNWMVEVLRREVEERVV